MDEMVKLGDVAADVVRAIPYHPNYADGIYFDLPAAAYHADRALGSGDMKRLAANPVAWWYSSKHNPRRPAERDTAAMRFGRAVHCMVIEGRQFFDSHFAPTDHPGTHKAGKDEREEIRAAGKVALSREDYDRALIAGTYVTADPELAQAFIGGAGEVSVFWTRDGIRRKARFDYLKVRSLVDLKSTYETDEIEFDANCKRLIAKRRMYIQTAHYYEAREAILNLVRDGRISGEPPDMDWLKRVALQPLDKVAWVWVFFQSSGAPETFGTYTDHGGKLHDMGRAQLGLAQHHYQTFGDKFGFDGTPWVRVRSLERYQEDEQPEYMWR